MAASTTSAGADIQRAARLLAEERAAEAIEVLESLTSTFPAYVTAHVLAAKAYETAGRPSDALQAWHRAQFLMPASPLITRHRLRLLQEDFEEGEAPQAKATATAQNEAPVMGGPAVPQGEPHQSTSVAAAETDEEVEAAAAVETDQEIGTDHAHGRREERAEPQPDLEPEPEPESSRGGHAPSFEEFAWIDEAEILPPYNAREPEPQPSPDADDGWRVVDHLDPQEDDSSEQHASHASAEESLSEADVESSHEPSSEAPHHEHVEDPGRAEPSEVEEPGEWVTFDARPSGASDDDQDPMAGLSDLDALIEQLENAPRIRPGDSAHGSVEPDLPEGEEEVVTETLARIYEAQRQYEAAARAYDALARQHPQRAEEFMLRAAELRRRGAS